MKDNECSVWGSLQGLSSKVCWTTSHLTPNELRSTSQQLCMSTHKSLQLQNRQWTLAIPLTSRSWPACHTSSVHLETMAQTPLGRNTTTSSVWYNNHWQQEGHWRLQQLILTWWCLPLGKHMLLIPKISVVTWLLYLSVYVCASFLLFFGFFWKWGSVTIMLH